MSAKNREKDREQSPDAPPPDRLVPFLTAPGLAARTGRVAGVGGLSFLVAWYVSYLFLPEGLLRHGTTGGFAAGGAFIAAAIVAGNLLLRVRGLPTGYLAAAWGFLYAGILAGTNSFLVPYSQRITPTFRVFSRGIIYEMAAWAILSAASAGWALFEMDRLGAGPKKAASRATRVELAAAAAGILILAAALALEAAGILPA